MFWKLIVVFSVLVLSCYLFYKASGTLNPIKVNVITYFFYLFILHNFLGSSLVFLGLKKHYLISKIVNENTINKTYFIICFTALVFPIAMIVVSRLFKVNVRKQYEEFLKKSIIIENDDYIFIVTSIISIFCLILTIVMFKRMKTIPLINLIFNRGLSSMGVDRINISKGTYINQYLRNFLVLGITPLLSYLAYIYYKCTKKRNWGILFLLLFIASIFIKTYNYAKSPVITYIFMFVFINIIIKGKIKLKSLIKFAVLGIGVLGIMYIKMGYNFSNGIDIYSGPFGRFIFTQIATLFLHVDLFPNFIPYLNWRSLSPSILGLIFNGSKHIRSGRAVMQFYSPDKVVNGTAGVMNTLFVGEAYANFGIIGVILGVIYVGIIFESVYLMFIKNKKTPTNVIMYIFATQTLVEVSQSGFTDYIYNSNAIVNIGLILFIVLIAKLLEKKKMLNDIIIKIRQFNSKGRKING